MSNEQDSGAPTADPETAELGDFETSLDELETLVQSMESGELTLEQSLAAFERGIALTRQCQQALQAAEQRVAFLTEGSEADDAEES